jgi:hypothetical protein
MLNAWTLPQLKSFVLNRPAATYLDWSRELLHVPYCERAAVEAGEELFAVGREGHCGGVRVGRPAVQA